MLFHKALGALALGTFAVAVPSPPPWAHNENSNGGRKHLEKSRVEEPFFYKGYDLSSLKIEEDGGYIYKDTQRNNVTRPVEDILGDGGMNTVRLRLWVNPKVPYDGMHYLALQEGVRRADRSRWLLRIVWPRLHATSRQALLRQGLPDLPW